MAILTEGRILVTDASNVPISGGKVRIYNTGTTTLTSVFSDAALATPLTNPVVANSAGFTPVIFAAEGTSVDLTYLTAADATVANRTYTAVPFLGADTGDFTRTVSGNGRFKVTGSAGAVLLQAGDASPDNTGGTLTIEGWAGTQLDTLTLDAATTNTTGRVTEIGKKIVGTVYTPATTFTGATTVDIPLTADPAGVRAWEVFLFDIAASSAITFGVRLSYDGGATYKAGASDYSGAANYSVYTAPNTVATSLSTLSGTIYNFPVTIAATANRPVLAKLEIITPTSGSDSTVIMGNIVTYDGVGGANAAPIRVAFTAYGNGAYGKATHIRLVVSGGTVTGKYRVVPLRGFGE